MAERKARRKRTPKEPTPGGASIADMLRAITPGLDADAYPKEAPSFPEISEPKKRLYLVALCRTGRFGAAANAAGIDVRTAYNWRKGDPDFAKAEQEAKEIGVELAEDEAWRRATQGVMEPVYQGGMLVGYKRVMSDTLLIFMLKGAMPEKYRERMEHRHTGIGPNSPEGVLLRMAGQTLPTGSAEPEVPSE